MKTSHKHTHTENMDLQFKMSFRTGTETIRAGEPIKLYFKPELVSQPGSVVPLSLFHERKIHLIIMSKDLNYFAHEHPELLGNGDYMWEHIFPAGGDYLLFQDYMPEEAVQQLGRQEIHVAGEETPKGLTDKVTTVWEEDEYEVKIHPDNQLVKANAAVILKAEVAKNGEPITDLEKYLGSLAHVVVVSSDTQDYLHVHPMESATNGPEIILHTHFPRSGHYKIFMEFKHEGQVRLAIFVLAARN
jgi:hypothetical protein